MKALSIIAVILLQGSVLAGLAEPQQETEPISVCDVLRDPVKYNGKMIAVRGFLISTDEGHWLNGDCEEPLITNGYKWKSAIWPESPSSRSALHKVAFEEDFEAETAMYAVRNREMKDPRHDRLWVTYIGLLETRQSMDIEVFVRPNGERQPVGFGHLGGAPAQILIKTVKDIVVEHLADSKSTDQSSPPQ